MKLVFRLLFLILCLTIAHAQEKGRLSVRSDSSIVTVYLDTTLIGRTPVDSVTIDEGKHILHFVQSNTLNWYQSPVVETVMVAPGEHIKRNVLFSSFGYMPHVIPSPWQSVSLNDSLSRIPTTALEGKVVPSTVPLYLTTAGAIVCGSLAAYFKLQADKEYDDYQYTGDQESLKRVKRNDTISGIALVACEINLVALTYLLLSR